MYRIRIKRPAEKYLNKISGKMYRSIRVKIEELKTDPVPGDAVPLRGHTNTYRIRIGSIRIIYEIFRKELVIVVIDIGQRGQIYGTY
jgi:mRNA interferase RelE/StbE